MNSLKPPAEPPFYELLIRKPESKKVVNKKMVAAPNLKMPNTDAFLQMYPDASSEMELHYSHSYCNMAMYKETYHTSFNSRGMYWLHARVLKKLISDMQPPPPYSP